MPSEFRRSPLALAILGVLAAGPLHPYGIQRRIREWGKDDVVNVGQRASLYKMITRLEQAGLVTASGTDRDPSYPERTAYAITDDGQRIARQWLEEIVSTPRNEFPEFPAGLSFLPLVTPAVTAQFLGARRAALQAMLAELDDAAAVAAALPRIVLIEDEYRRAVLSAELAWVEAVLADLDSGALTWTTERLIEIADGAR